MAQSAYMTVMVVFATPERVWQHAVTLPPGGTVRMALDGSGFCKAFPSLSADTLAVGVFGQRCELDTVLHDGDRVEVYRPLAFDPMESRRRRAAHRRAGMTKRLRS